MNRIIFHLCCFVIGAAVVSTTSAAKLLYDSTYAPGGILQYYTIHYYNAANRDTCQLSNRPNKTLLKYTISKYNAAGKVTSEYNFNSAKTRTDTTGYTYDANNRISTIVNTILSLSDPPSSTKEYLAYNANGMLTKDSLTGQTYGTWGIKRYANYTINGSIASGPARNSKKVIMQYDTIKYDAAINILSKKVVYATKVFYSLQINKWSKANQILKTTLFTGDTVMPDIYINYWYDDMTSIGIPGISVNKNPAIDQDKNLLFTITGRSGILPGRMARGAYISKNSRIINGLKVLTK